MGDDLFPKMFQKDEMCTPNTQCSMPVCEVCVHWGLSPLTIVEDNLLRVTQRGEAILEDEELSPTIENFIVLT